MANQENLSEKTNELLAQNPIQWLKDGVLNKVNELSQSVSVDNQLSSQTNDNFTESFSQMVFNELKSRNQNGLTQKNGQPAIFAPNEDIVSQNLGKFLSDKSTNAPPGLYHPKVDEKKFKISQDISKDNQIKYLKALEVISQNRLGDFNKTSDEILNEIVEKNDASLAIQLADIYGKIADDYYQVSIPINWVDFHKITMSHFYSSQSLWQEIADFQNDPLKAYLATQFISNVQNSAKGVQALLSRGILKNNLSFK